MSNQPNTIIHIDGFVVTFSQHENAGPFAAMRAAERYIRNRGWTVGPSQRSSPRGIMFDKYVIAKWRNLSWAERVACDAYLVGNGRYGPLTITTQLESCYSYEWC